MWATCVLLLVTAGARKPVETARMYGNVNQYAYYFVDLLVGTPPQLTSVIVDTGSHLLAFPCGGCEKCGHHLEPAVNLSKSSTAEWQQCTASCKCSNDNRCKYSETYSEGSAISGHWFTDRVRIGDSFEKNNPVVARMGCHDSENKLFYTQQANGIMGLAPVLPASWAPPEAAHAAAILEDLFRDKKHIDHRVFSLCLGDWGGLLTVGGPNEDYHKGGITWIGMSALGYYVVHPTSFHVDSLIVTASPDEFGRAIVDSGTTLTYFPSEIYKRLVMNIENYCGVQLQCHAERDEDNEGCWRLSDPTASPDSFPTLHLRFDQGDAIPWAPTAYLSQRGYGEWCYAMAESQNGDTILGISWMLHRDTVFDMAGKVIGMATADCPNYKQVPTSLWERLAFTLKARPAGSWVGVAAAGCLAFASVSYRFLRAPEAIDGDNSGLLAVEPA